jgi:protein-tyrosine-phosphatase
MAEALLRKHAGDRLEVASAGFEPTDVHPLTREVLSEVGIDGSNLSAKGLREFLAKHTVRHAIIVCAQAESSVPKSTRSPGDVVLGLRRSAREGSRAAAGEVPARADDRRAYSSLVTGTPRVSDDQSGPPLRAGFPSSTFMTLWIFTAMGVGLRSALSFSFTATLNA